jgi:predicted nucleic acid-binding protein
VIILDACVLIAFADTADAHHAAATAILASSETLAVSSLTGAEVMVHPPAEAEAAWLRVFGDFGIKIFPLAERDMPILADVRRRTRLKMPDAIVVFLARREGAAVASFDDRLLRAARSLGLPVFDGMPAKREE